MSIRNNIIFTICIAILACNAENRGQAVTQKPVNPDTVQVTRTMYDDSLGITDSYYASIRQQERWLGLDRLDNGYDSMQIRIWGTHARIPGMRLLILKCASGKWEGDLLVIESNPDTSSGKQAIIKEQKSITPKSGWNSLIEKLSALQITSLPHMLELPGLTSDFVDGPEYGVEIAVRNAYRFYWYWSPQGFKEYQQTRNMSAILQLLGEEFGIQDY
jgi:hypothetical protein